MPIQAIRKLVLAVATLSAIYTQVHADELFAPELVRFQKYKLNAVFAGEGDGHWEARIRERGCILREEDGHFYPACCPRLPRRSSPRISIIAIQNSRSESR